MSKPTKPQADRWLDCPSCPRRYSPMQAGKAKPTCPICQQAESRHPAQSTAPPSTNKVDHLTLVYSRPTAEALEWWQVERWLALTALMERPATLQQVANSAEVSTTRARALIAGLRGEGYKIDCNRQGRDFYYSIETR